MHKRLGKGEKWATLMDTNNCLFYTGTRRKKRRKKRGGGKNGKIFQIDINWYSISRLKYSRFIITQSAPFQIKYTRLGRLLRLRMFLQILSRTSHYTSWERARGKRNSQGKVRFVKMGKNICKIRNFNVTNRLDSPYGAWCVFGMRSRMQYKIIKHVSYLPGQRTYS